jgi:anti-sigma-K factor RskA
MDMRPPGCGEDVAPYLLGALERDDAERFERHLETCELCQADLERLRPAVDALPAAAEPLAPPAELRTRIMAEVKRDAAERRKAAKPARSRPAWLRPIPALAAACVLLLVGVGVGIGLSGGETRTVDGQVAIAGATAQLEIDDGSGELRVTGMPSPPNDRVWQVWLVRGSDPPQPTDALFTPDRTGRASVGVPGDLDDVDRILVSQEPRGGSMQPTTAPQIDIGLT